MSKRYNEEPNESEPDPKRRKLLKKEKLQQTSPSEKTKSPSFSPSSLFTSVLSFNFLSNPSPKPLIKGNNSKQKSHQSVRNLPDPQEGGLGSSAVNPGWVFLPPEVSPGNLMVEEWDRLEEDEDEVKIANEEMERIQTEEEFNREFHHIDITIKFDSVLERRNRVAYEVLTTEVTYVKLLQVCTMVYINPLEQWSKKHENSKVVSMLNLFQTLRDILNVNSILLNDLRQRFINWSDSQKIGDVMLTISPFLKMYRTYGECYESVVETLEHYRTIRPNKQFISILAAGESHPLAKKYSIDSMLILPVQRVPRYVLLLMDLLRHTPREHPDYMLVEKSTEAMKEVAFQINTAISQAESREKCIKIQSKFDTKFGSKSLPISTLVEPHRVFIKEGVLLKQFSNDRKPRRFFLFNDLLIYTHPTVLHSERLIVDHTFFLETTFVEETYPGECNFLIRGYGEAFLVFTDTLEEKMEWMKALDESIKAHKETYAQLKLRGLRDAERGSAALWVPDEATEHCMRCNRDFSMFKRKHHCRHCGFVVCGDCSKSRAIVPGVDCGEHLRVCSSCDKILNKSNGE